MTHSYEILNFEANTPFRCRIHQIGHIGSHFHEYFEIIFILSGYCNITVEEQLYKLRPDDILIVESHTLHELHASDCVYVSVQLDQTSLEKNFANPLHPKFECNSQIPGKEKAFGQMRHLIALIVKNNADQRTGYELRNWIYVYQLMDILFTNFHVERSAALDKKNYRYATRMSEITHIVKEHYMEDLSLSALADMLHLSSPYLSKFFMDQFGMNYLSYLTEVRINHAVHELVHTEKNIEEISADSGFPNSHAFTKAFKKKYDMLPSAYRRSQLISETNTEKLPSLEQHDYMLGLKKHLETEWSETIVIPSVSTKGEFWLSSSTKSLSHTWKNVASVGQASDILLSDIQEMLRRLQSEIGYKYLFFNGIFSDDMHLYTVDDNNKPYYNFTYVDKVLDFLLKINMKPFMQLTYMPSALAKYPWNILFQHLVSEPKDNKLWCELVYTFMEHIISRYGIEEILTWKFSVWHQPDTPFRLYGFENNNDFFAFYQKTFQTVKGFNNDICFGLPATFYLNEQAHSNWYLTLLKWACEHECAPDFISFSFYDVKLSTGSNESRSTFGFVDPLVLNSQTNGLKEFIANVKQDLQTCGAQQIPIYVCEWNNTPSQQDLLNDTCYKSCYIVKNILENYDKLCGISYWSLTDLMTEAPLPDKLLYGGLGLFTKNGMPKPSYYSFCILNQLGDEFIAKGDNWYATRTSKDIRIIAYHYKHITPLYCTGERFDMTENDRYTMFEPSETLELNLQIHDMEDKEYMVTEYVLNRESGSLYDAWVKMGCIDPQSEQEMKLLGLKSIPSILKSKKAASEGTLTLKLRLDLLEVRLVIIK
jgi:xylan 1,4-beta-xylosidase